MAQQNSINNKSSVFSSDSSITATSGNITATTGNITATLGDLVSTGITFDGGTNTISTFTKNTFVPTLTFGGASVGMTFSAQTGEYVRINSAVFIRIQLTLTAKGSSVGTAVISNLPFTAAASPNGFAALGIQWGVLTGAHIIADIGDSNAKVDLARVGSGLGAALLANTDFADTSNMVIEGWYFV